MSQERDVLVCQQSARDLQGLVDQYGEGQQLDVSEFNSLLDENGPNHERLLVKLVCKTVELVGEFVNTEKRLTHVLSKLVSFYKSAGESWYASMNSRDKYFELAYGVGQDNYTSTLVSPTDRFERLLSEELTFNSLVASCKDGLQFWEGQRRVLAEYLALVDTVAPGSLPSNLPKKE